MEVIWVRGRSEMTEMMTLYDVHNESCTWAGVTKHWMLQFFTSYIPRLQQHVLLMS